MQFCEHSEPLFNAAMDPITIFEMNSNGFALQVVQDNRL